MTPLHGQKNVPRPLPMPQAKPESLPAASSEEKVKRVAGRLIIPDIFMSEVSKPKVAIPQAPGPMPDSPMVNKVKADIKKTKDFIDAGGKVATFTDQIAAKAVEISVKSRDLLPVTPEVQQEENAPEPVDTKHEGHKETRASIKQHVWSKVSLPKEHHTSTAEAATQDPKSQPYSKQKEVKQFEETIQKEISEKAAHYRRKVIQDDIDISKGRI